MSQCQLQQQSQNLSYTGPPKKFLRKGEGLKRFAAYKPPLPVTSIKKVQRRQTFVKFKLDNKITARDKSTNDTFYYPDILNNDSVNLSTEVPKIAPPKIMHTPIRPNRQALGTIRSQNQPSSPARPPIIRRAFGVIVKTQNQQTQNQQASNQPTPIKSTELKECAAAPKRYNLRGSRKPNCENAQARDIQPTPIDATATSATMKKETRRNKRQAKAIVERHILPPQSPSDDINIVANSEPDEFEINGDIDNLFQKIEKKKSSLEGNKEYVNEDRACERISPSQQHEYEHHHQTPIINSKSRNRKCYHEFDLSTPTPGSCILALGQQIQQIENKVNELKNQFKNCECGAIQSHPKQQLAKPSPPATRGRKANTRSKVEEKNRPSADADNNTIPKILASLEDVMSQLRAGFVNIDFKN